MIAPSNISPDWLAEYPPPRSLPLDQEALRIYEHAYYVGLGTEGEGPPISFSTVILALLEGRDETSVWFAGLASQLGPSAQAVYAEKKIEKPIISTPFPTGKPNQVKLSKDKQLLTVSARTVIENAEGWAHLVGGGDIGVRHLVASYVLNPPPDHRAQMQEWGFQESRWRSAFFDWVAERYTAEAWLDASQRPAPSKAIPSFEEREVKGDTLAYPGDPVTHALLDEAARYHARQDDSWLRVQTVFFTMIETARADESLRMAIQPLWSAIEAVEPQYIRARDAYFIRPLLADSAASFSALNISPRVLNALETARELAVATHQDPDSEVRVTPLQLAGALVSRRVDEDEELTKLGLKPQELRLALIEFAQSMAQSAEVWQEALGEEESLRAGRPVDLNSDEPEAAVRLDEAWANDPLQIRPDVEAFAALLASKSLEPPLSIGLFGPWGSGKTTFLNRLRRAVRDRAEEAKASILASKPTPYISNVVHVHFNAWHFAEDALTSSMVDTILRALSEHIKDEQVVGGKEWRQQKLAALETTRRNLEAARALEGAAKAAASEAEKALVLSQAEAAGRISNFQAVVQGVWTATKDSLKASPDVRDSGVLEVIGDTIKSTDELQGRLNEVRTRPARLLGDLGWTRSLVFAGLVLAVPPVIGWVVGKVLDTGQAGQLLSSVTAMLSVIAVWARSATGAVSKVDKVITQVADAYTQRLAADKDVVAAKGNLDVAEAKATSAAAALQVAREALARAQAEAANASLPAQLLQLVSGRLEDRSYKKELTTISLARADLEALSAILRGQRDDATSAGNGGSASGDPATASPRAVDRVILYIDDLDRCQPADVVRVLQLVHMLLAFELFVVVVAVDAAWVEQALMRRYPWLAGKNGSSSDGEGAGDERPAPKMAGVTPRDYLEKIFQISFWLEPMTSQRAARYLGSLVRAPARESGPVRGSGFVSPQNGGLEQGSPVVTKVEIAAIELDYMRWLAAYVGPSPRRVKRLVNAYRLIKARMPDSQLSRFLTVPEAGDQGVIYRSGPYQLVIALLVIGTGAPSTSAQILKELAEWDPGSRLDEVVEEFRARNHPDWTMAAKVIEMVMGTQKAEHVRELRGWAHNVGRFLLSWPVAASRAQRTQPAAGAEEPREELDPIAPPKAPQPGDRASTGALAGR